jgi:PAS domain S-box-containing protein
MKASRARKSGSDGLSLYREAKSRLGKDTSPGSVDARKRRPPVTEPERLYHELQVHQVELQMQNNELMASRNRAEVLLEKYADLYDFAPVGYLSLNEEGRIREVNLRGAALLGVERSRLINRRLTAMVGPAGRKIFQAFLKRVFAGEQKQVCEVAMLRGDRSSFWADLHGTLALALNGGGKWCRIVVSDVSRLKRAEAAEILNAKLRVEIERRKASEASLRLSGRNQRRLLKESRRLASELQNLSRQVITVQEEERKRISRELHDVIGQILSGINLRLVALKKEAGPRFGQFARSVDRTQQLMESSARLIHQFARDLRPTALDDLGLVPALQSFAKDFSQRNRLHIHLKVSAVIGNLATNKRTALYRVAQEALANVARHARARRVEVNIQKLADIICMQIQDDGRSFSVERVLAGRGRKRLGLLGMRERLEMVGGRLGIESTPGTGTTVTAEIPAG